MKGKRWVKYLCLFALTLVVALSAAGTKQAQAATKSGSCGDKATYEYDTSTKTLTISGSGTVEAPSYWSKISGSVKKLVVGDKITDIGTYTEWSALKTVKLGAKVKTINSSAFENCSSLTTVDMGDSAVKTIGDYAFCYCVKLKTVTFSTKLTKIGSAAFQHCVKITSLSLPSSLKTIGSYAFQTCSGLEKITIPKNVTSIGSSVFTYCYSLTKIAVSSGNTKYSAKSGVLYNKDKTKLICYPAAKSSTSFTIPKTVTTIAADAFCSAEKLKSVNVNKVQKIGSYAFEGCTGLTKITLTNSVTSIGRMAFIFCSSLEKITIPKNVTSMGLMPFQLCTSLEKIAVSSSNTKYSAKDGVLYNKAKTKLIAYPIAKSGSSFTVPSTVKTINDYAFANNKKLKSITIGSKVTTIGTYAFGGCAKLKTVTFKGSAPEFAYNEGPECYDEFDGTTDITVKYPASKKSSWTASLRKNLKAGVQAGGTLTFEAY